MAVHKAKRSNPLAQPQPARAPQPSTRNPSAHNHPQPKTCKPTDPQLKAEFFEALRHLNRGFGVALAAFDRLQTAKTASTSRASSPPTACTTTATARKRCAPWPTATCSASSPDAKTRTRSASNRKGNNRQHTVTGGSNWISGRLFLILALSDQCHPY